MLKNYLKLTLRNIKEQKGYSFINIISLAVGLSCCILILLYIRYEFSYDKYHNNARYIYRAVREYQDRPVWFIFLFRCVHKLFENGHLMLNKHSKIPGGNIGTFMKEMIDIWPPQEGHNRGSTS